MSKRYEVKDDGRHIGGYLGGSHVVAWQPGSHSAALVRQLLADIAERDARIAELTASRDFAMEERDGWIVSHAQLFRKLGDLLAVIHRDGGHYEAEHGTEKACADAETAVHVLRGSLDGYIEANRYMKGELDDALEDARKYCAAQVEIARLRGALSLALDEIRECDDTDGVRAKVIDVLAAMAEVEAK